jgi:hypothetical protein
MVVEGELTNDKLMRSRRKNQLKEREPGSASPERGCNATAVGLYREDFFIPSKSDWCASMTCRSPGYPP